MFFYGESGAIAATNSLSGVTYTAKIPGSAGNNITINHVEGTAGTAATTAKRTFFASAMVMGQLSFGTFQVSALNTGTGGNNISIIFQLGGVGVSAIKTGNTITVSHPGTITVSQLHTALSSVATGLIAVGAISGNGSLSFSPLPNSGNLSGGTNAVTAETTAVIVGGGDLNATSITVRIAAAETDIAVVVSVVNDAATSVTASGTGSIGAKTDSVALIGGSD